MSARSLILLLQLLSVMQPHIFFYEADSPQGLKFVRHAAQQLRACPYDLKKIMGSAKLSREFRGLGYRADLLKSDELGPMTQRYLDEELPGTLFKIRRNSCPKRVVSLSRLLSICPNSTHEDTFKLMIDYDEETVHLSEQFNPLTGATIGYTCPELEFDLIRALIAGTNDTGTIFPSNHYKNTLFETCSPPPKPVSDEQSQEDEDWLMEDLEEVPLTEDSLWWPIGYIFILSIILFDLWFLFSIGHECYMYFKVNKREKTLPTDS